MWESEKIKRYLAMLYFYEQDEIKSQKKVIVPKKLLIAE